MINDPGRAAAGQAAMNNPNNNTVSSSSSVVTNGARAHTLRINRKNATKP